MLYLFRLLKQKKNSSINSLGKYKVERKINNFALIDSIAHMEIILSKYE